MLARYRLTSWDLGAYLVHQYVRSWLLHGVSAMLLYVALRQSLRMMMLHPIPLPRLLMACLVIALVVLAGIWAVLLGHVALFMVTRRNDPYLTDHTLRLTAEGVVDELPQRRLEMKWPAFRGITVTRHHLLLYMTARNALIIPKRAFPSTGELESFVAACREGIREGRLALPASEAGIP